MYVQWICASTQPAEATCSSGSGPLACTYMYTSSYNKRDFSATLRFNFIEAIGISISTSSRLLKKKMSRRKRTVYGQRCAAYGLYMHMSVTECAFWAHCMSSSDIRLFYETQPNSRGVGHPLPSWWGRGSTAKLSEVIGRGQLLSSRTTCGPCSKHF